MRSAQRKSTHVYSRDPGQKALTRGLVLMVIAMLIVPGMDVITKFLSGTINGVQVGQARFGFQAAFLLPVIVLMRGPRALMPAIPKLNTARAVCMAGAVLLFFTSLKWLPVADAIAIFFVEPLILTVLSAVFLGEHVGWPRRIAVLAGFLGALIVVRPSYEVFGLVALLPLGAALFFAVYLMFTSKLSKSEDAMTMQFFSGVVGFLVLSAVMVFGEAASIEILSFAWPTATEWLWLTTLGAIATVLHLMIVHAFRAAPASVLAPFNYLEIVSATILGYLVFGDFPDQLKWLGITIIVSSGLFVFWRESRTGA
ncbi:MAG: DMT family transporter [Hyphomicrobiales bacterium]